MDYLNEIEKAEVQKFIDNPTLYQAVKKVLLAEVYYNGTLHPGEVPVTTKNFALGKAFDSKANNEEIGQHFRGVVDAISLLENGDSFSRPLKSVRYTFSSFSSLCIETMWS